MTYAWTCASVRSLSRIAGISSSPSQLRRCQAPVARDDLPVLIDQDGVRPAECLDGRSDLPDLLVRVGTGISRIRLEGRDPEMLNLEIQNAFRHRTRLVKLTGFTPKSL